MANGAMPTISVIIPSHNAAPWIEQAVRSALEQTFRDVEVIAVDDGSADETLAALQRITDPRLRVIARPHEGRSAARNAGIANSRGDFIAFLDADDWWLPEKLARQLALFHANPELGAAYCWLRQVGPAGEHLRTMRGAAANCAPGGADIFEQLMFGNVGGPGSTLVIRRDVAEAVGGFPPDMAYGEDWDYCLRIAARYQVGYVPETLAAYRVYGRRMPEKMHALGMQAAVTATVRNALARRAGVHPDVARRAEAQAECLAAFVDAAVGDGSAANRRLAAALALNPALFDGNEPPFALLLAHFANNLYDTTTPLDEALGFAAGVIALLDAPLRARAERRRGEVMSLIAALRVFETEACDPAPVVRSAFWRAIATEPRWLRNVGFVKRGLAAHLPRSARGETR